MPAPTSACDRGVISLARAIRNWGSAKKAMDSCDDYWCRPRNISWGHSDLTLTCAAGVGRLVARGGRGAKSRAVVAVARSYQSFFTISGLLERPTIHCGIAKTDIALTNWCRRN